MTDNIRGVFLQERESKIGTGHTKKIVKQKMYCIANQINDNEIEVRYLGANDKPLNITETIPKDEFIRNFTFQPYYYEKKKAEGQEKEINKHIAVAEEHAKKKEFYSAEYEYKNALKIDEENLRANFGIGNVYLSMGEEKKAKEIFIKISTIDAIFEEQNKHFFNECAIQLRKHKLYDEAINYYTKAIELSPRDENLYFNIARPHFEKGNIEQARNHIYKALEIRPEFPEGQAFLTYIDNHKDEKLAQKTPAAAAEPVLKAEAAEKTEAEAQKAATEQDKSTGSR